MFYSYRSTFMAVLGLAALLSAGAVRADDNADVSALMRAGRFGEAMQKVDSALAQRPRDAQMRFLKGLILTEQNKNAEAIAVFTKLSEDHPELPEPYNNLAVLYAGSGQYDKARTALEMAIRTNPTYATAHENLGDVYARLASQAYDKALQLDSGNQTAKSKLTLVRTLVTTPGGTAARPAAPAARPATPAVTPPAPAVVAKVEPKAETPKAEPKVASKPAETKKPEPRGADDRDDVLRAVNGWARAWSAKDTRNYLAAYGDDFQPPGGASRKAWAEERRSRIEGKGSISVKLDGIKINVDGNSATASFRQTYVAGALNSTTRKTLVLSKQGNRWQIKQERTGG